MEKCDFDRQFLSHSYLLNFFFKFYTTGGNQKLKAWSFQLRKDYFCVLNIERPIAHQSSICTKSFKFLGHSYGNYFNPAEDCSHVVDNVPEPESGVYWIQTKKGPIKVSPTM